MRAERAERAEIDGSVARSLLLPAANSLDLTPALETLAAQGYAPLGNVFADEGLALLRERADQVMLGKVEYPGLFFQHESTTGRYEDLELGRGYQGPSLDYRKIEKLEVDPRFRALIENPLFERVTRARIDGDVVLYRAILMTKGPSGGTALPWHQDGGQFWGVAPGPTLQIWTAIDDATIEAGCLEFIPKTHLDGLATPNGGVVPPNVLARRDLAAETVKVPARAGDVVLIHNHVWHRSANNTTGRARRAFSVCFMSASTRCLRKKRAPRTFVPVFRG